MMSQSKATMSGRDASNGTIGPMSTASIAENVLAQGATAGGDIVATLIESQPIASASNPLETLTSTKRFTTVTRCEYCEREFTPHRPHGRFCSAYCRRRAWLERNPEKAAELAEKDKARLKARVIERGGAWVDK